MKALVPLGGWCHPLPRGSREPRLHRLALAFRFVAIMATGNKIRVLVRTAMCAGHDVIHLGGRFTAVHARMAISVEDVLALAFPRCVIDCLVLATSDIPAGLVLIAVARTTRY